MSSISSKLYSPGDVIQVCQPFVHSIAYECKAQYCDYCLIANQSLKKCSICEQMFYCDRKCQLNDWKCHKLECQMYIKYPEQLKPFIETVGENYYIMLFRLVLMLNAYPSLATKKYPLFNGTERCFDELLSHEQHLKPIFDSESRFGIFFSVIQSLGIELSAERYHTLLGQILINIFGLNTADHKQKPIGIGLYVPISVFNHSCHPNAIFLNCGTKMQIRSMDTIKPNEEIFLCYIAIDRPKQERQKRLQITKCFECRCVKCDSDWDSTFDYEKFMALNGEYTKLTEKLSYKKCENIVAKRIKLGEQLLVMKKQLYKCFSHNIGYDMFVQSMNMLDAMYGGMCGQTVTRESVTQFMKLTKQYLTVTHGIDHPFYQFFTRIAKLNHICI